MGPCQVADALRRQASGLLWSAVVIGALGCAWNSPMSGFAPPKKGDTAAFKTQASPANGQEVYRSYCASCHGLDAKGAGPAAESLRMRPTDLTLLQKRNGGQFPAYRVERLLGGTDEIPVHGSRTMPVWGPVFRSLNRNDSLGAINVRNLVSYLESIQVK